MSDTRIAYFKRIQYTFITIDEVQYVSLHSLRLKERPHQGLIFQTLQLGDKGYNPIEIITVENAIKLLENEEQKQYLQGATNL